MRLPLPFHPSEPPWSLISRDLCQCIEGKLTLPRFVLGELSRDIVKLAPCIQLCERFFLLCMFLSQNRSMARSFVDPYFQDSYLAKNVPDVDALRSLLLRRSTLVGTGTGILALALIAAFAFGCHGVNTKSAS